MAAPTKDTWLAAVGVALGAAMAEIGRIFDSAPDSAAARDRVIAYLNGKFAAEALARLADGVPQELVALGVTGLSEVRKPKADLA